MIGLVVLLLVAGAFAGVAIAWVAFRFVRGTWQRVAADLALVAAPWIVILPIARRLFPHEDPSCDWLCFTDGSPPIQLSAKREPPTSPVSRFVSSAPRSIAYAPSCR